MIHQLLPYKLYPWKLVSGQPFFPLASLYTRLEDLLPLYSTSLVFRLSLNNTYLLSFDLSPRPHVTPSLDSTHFNPFNRGHRDKKQQTRDIEKAWSQTM